MLYPSERRVTQLAHRVVCDTVIHGSHDPLKHTGHKRAHGKRYKRTYHNTEIHAARRRDPVDRASGKHGNVKRQDYRGNGEHKR